MTGFGFDVARSGSEAVVTPRGELDMVAAPSLLRLLEELCEADQTVVVDLREADFIDSSGFSALVRAHRRYGDKLSFVRPAGQVARALEVTGLDRLVPFEDGR
jgi:anti-anti-sigma factor